MKKICLFIILFGHNAYGMKKELPEQFDNKKNAKFMPNIFLHTFNQNETNDINDSLPWFCRKTDFLKLRNDPNKTKDYLLSILDHYKRQ
jgi:hypothetical protein